ncbi:MAG: CAP domain-containing protein [Anaerolineae bacterium]|nr:CAP domain-containing protein [Anaerolineae bacterium]
MELAELLEQDPGQKRPSLTCNSILAQVAHARAADMAQREYFSHVNPDGHGPNYLVEEAGYILPSFYSDDPAANNIESIAAGRSTAEATWEQWMASSSHRTHLLGLDSFFAEQIEYGVGYVYDADSPYGHYWVVITAKPGP